MKNPRDISMSVIKRLPRYHRFLSELQKSGQIRTSSKELAEKMGLTASQIRQDFNCFGGYGQQGYGYNVDQLTEAIGNILGLGSKTKAILIGSGNLGKAIASHLVFTNKGFSLVAVFDSDKSLSGTKINNLTVESTDNLKSFCKENKPSVAVLCIPTKVAKGVVDELMDLGIKGFWNFTHYDILSKYPNAYVENVHLNDSLMTLSYLMNSNSSSFSD